MRPSLLLALLAAYLLARASLGAMLNPPLNGPDEGGHLEYVRTLDAGGLAGVTGVEAKQPPTYYTLALLPWRLSTGQPEEARLFWVRMLSAVTGVATLAVTWHTARRVWPGRPALAAGAAILLLAPGHLYVLASANNDALACLAAAGAVLAAAGVVAGGPLARRWAVAWALFAALAVATKVTTVPVVVATAIAFGLHWRDALRRSRTAYLAGGAVAAGALTVYALLLSHPPTTSLAASVAHYGPRALLLGPLAYVGDGGPVETVRTWSYGYDYLVRFPQALERGLGALTAIVLLGAGAGLALAMASLLGGRDAGDTGTGPRSGITVPLVVWLPGAAQAAFVVTRYGLSQLMQIEPAGAAQAKAFFPALLPITILGVAGLATAGRPFRLPDSWLALGLFAWVLALDVASLAVTTWHHYRWWQVGL